MIKLIGKYLKVSVLPILLIIALLVVQAMCDLKLPDYTSSIVNVGIQQGGIAYAAPTTVREKQMQGILAFVYDEQDTALAVPQSIKAEDYDKILSLVVEKGDKERIESSYKKQNTVYTLQGEPSAALAKALEEPIAMFLVLESAFQNPDMVAALAGEQQGDIGKIPPSFQSYISVFQTGTYAEKWEAVQQMSTALKKVVINALKNSDSFDSRYFSYLSFIWCAVNEKAFGNTDFALSEKAKSVLSAYTLKDGVYQVNDESEKNMEQLSATLQTPIAVYAMSAQMASADAPQGEQGAQSGFDMAMLGRLAPALGLSEDAQISDFFALLPSSAKAQIMQKMTESTADYMDTIAPQYAVNWVKSEYEAQGLDMHEIQMHYLLMTGLKMAGVAALIMLCAVAITFVAGYVAARFGRDVRADVFHKVIGFSGKEFNRFSTASLITRSTNDIQQMQILIVMMLRMVFYAPIMAIGAVTKIIGTESSLAWIIAVAVVVIIVTVVILFAVVGPKFAAMQKLVDRLNLVAREILTGLPVIRAFSTEEHEKKRFDKANVDFTKVNLFTNRTLALMFPLITFIMSAVSCAVIWFGTKSVDAGTMQVGNMMAYMQYAIQILISFIMISMVSIFLPRARAAGDRVNEVLETEPSIKDPAKPLPFVAEKQGEVRFEHVSFKYSDTADNAIEDIDFTAPAGKVTAIIGGTGSGKSTLLNLVPRFYDATEGAVFVDGVNVKDVTQHDLRQIIGFVPQKAVLFSGTVDSNLRYGKQDASEEQIKTAAAIAQADEFIDAMPDGYGEAIAQSGSNVSGGQKQRLAIARAIAKDPEILVFDDSFSALDFKTDKKLRKELGEKTKGKTVIIVAQRISTVKNADKIIVLYDGRQVGEGTHEELMHTCKQYQEIALSQLSQEELNK